MVKKEQMYKHIAVLLFILCWFAYFYFLWRDMIVFDGNDLRVGGINVWGDWAMHFSQGSSFAYRSLFLTKHPLLLGAPFAYPFLVNWISGALVRMGMEFFSAFVVPSFALSLILVVVLLMVFQKIFRSLAVSLLSTTIFLLNGGMGWWWYIQDLIASPSLQTAFSFTKEYTHLTSIGIQWISVITSMIVPQRSFTFGFPIALSIALIVLRQIEKQRKEWSFRWFVVAGIVSGFMPLIHMHSFMMLALLMGCWMIWTFLRKETDAGRHHALACWSALLCTTMLVAFPSLILFYAQTVGKASHGLFVQWYPGWFVNQHAEHKDINWIWWWFLNWGITLPIGILGWFISKVRVKAITLPFFVMFIVLNLFLFQPYVWDNTKILVWASLGISGTAAYVIWRLLHQNVMLKLCACFLFFLMIFSGLLDAYAAVDKRRHNWSMYEASALVAVDDFKKLSQPTDIVLTSDSHNNPFMNLSGRQVVMGFRGWLWTYGFDYGQIEHDVMAMFRGEKDAELLLKNYGVKYVIFDDKVRNEYNGNEEFFSQRYEQVLEGGRYVVYKITQ